MEEILASIRRIISEDEAPAEGAAPAEAEPEPAPAPAAALPLPPEEPPEEVQPAGALELEADEEDEDDGVLELTDKVETLGDLDVYTPAAAPAPAPVAAAPPPAYEPPPVPDGEGLLSNPAASAAAAAFGQLSSTILMPREGRTLEDVVRELLRPMMKQWLDDNLPRIVEDVVRSEVERVSRGRVG